MSDTPRTDAHLAHLNLPDGRKIGIPNETVELLRDLERDANRWVCLPLLNPMDIAIEVTGAQTPQDLRRGLERKVDAFIEKYRRLS